MSLRPRYTTTRRDLEFCVFEREEKINYWLVETSLSLDQETANTEFSLLYFTARAARPVAARSRVHPSQSARNVIFWTAICRRWRSNGKCKQDFRLINNKNSCSHLFPHISHHFSHAPLYSIGWSPTRASHVSSKTTKTSTSSISRWNSTPLIRASSSKRLHAISFICSSNKMYCKEDFQSRSN